MLRVAGAMAMGRAQIHPLGYWPRGSVVTMGMYDPLIKRVALIGGAVEKEKRFSEDFVIAVLLIGVAAGVVSGMAIYAFAFPIFQSERWAAWVQAAGVIGAVGVAV